MQLFALRFCRWELARRSSVVLTKKEFAYVILDIAATELLPAIQEQDRYFNLAYPESPHQKTAKKSADKKGKQK